MRYIPAAITPIKVLDIIRAIYRSFLHKSTKRFEGQLAKFFDAQEVFTFGSLMRANYACFKAISQNSNRRYVILPRYSCPSFIHGVLAAGLQVKYCDNDPQTMNYDTVMLKEIIDKDILCVVTANLFGLTNPIDEILSYCNKYEVYVIEGVDYGIGTKYKGKLIGKYGHASILNFQEGKAIPICGGAIVSNTKIITEYFNKERGKLYPNYITMIGFCIFSKPTMYWFFNKIIALLGLKKAQFSMEDTIRNTQTENDFKFNNYKYTRAISDFQGALGSIVFTRLEQDLDTRTKNASKLSQELQKIDGIVMVPTIAGVEKVHYIRLPILVKNNKRNTLQIKLNRAGIEASPMYIEKGMVIDKEKYPGAHQLAMELLTIPCHPYVNNGDLNQIVKIIHSVMQKKK